MIGYYKQEGLAPRDRCSVARWSEDWCRASPRLQCELSRSLTRSSCVRLTLLRAFLPRTATFRLLHPLITLSRDDYGANEAIQFSGVRFLANSASPVFALACCCNSQADGISRAADEELAVRSTRTRCLHLLVGFLGGGGQRACDSSSGRQVHGGGAHVLLRAQPLLYHTAQTVSHTGSGGTTRVIIALVYVISRPILLVSSPRLRSFDSDLIGPRLTLQQVVVPIQWMPLSSAALFANHLKQSESAFCSQCRLVFASNDTCCAAGAFALELHAGVCGDVERGGGQARREGA